MEPRISPSVMTILTECKSPKRFSELRRKLTISKVSLYENLKRLQQRGWLKKTEDGSYVLTDEGRKVVEELEAYEVFLKAVREIGAREIKAALRLKLRLEPKRYEREKSLLNLFHALLKLRFWAYTSFEVRPLVSCTELDHLTDLFEEYLTTLMPRLYDTHLALKQLRDERRIEEAQKAILDYVSKGAYYHAMSTMASTQEERERLALRARLEDLKEKTKLLSLIHI